MQPRHPRRPIIRTVRREIALPRPPRPSARRKRVGARLRALLLLAVVAGGGWHLWQQSRAPRVTAQPVVAVRSGAVEEALEADALIVRIEQVVTAPVAGRVRRLAAEGERVRVGAPVVEILSGSPAPAAREPAAGQTTGGTTQAGQPVATTGATAAQREYDQVSGEIYRLAVALNTAKYGGEAEKVPALEAEIDGLARRQAVLSSQLHQSSSHEVPRPEPAPITQPTSTTPSADGTRVTSQVAGIVLYQTDGLEEVLTPEQAQAWTPSWLRALPYPDLKKTGEVAVVPGQPVFKVVDDLDLEMIVVVPAGRLTPSQRTILAESGVLLRIAGKERPMTARLRRMAEEGDSLLLHLTVPVPSSEALRVRRMRVQLLLETFEGIIVPRSAIDVQGGRTGVWVWARGEYTFTPVRTVGGNRDEVAVEGDLPPDAQVLRQLPPPGR